MGTEVQYNNYFPGNYSMKDHNDNTNNGSWPPYYDGKTMESRPYYNCFLPRPTTDGYFAFDKEILKQTMIKQETIFRSQVCELHRLYKIQQDLMCELRRKEPQKHLIPVAVQQSSPFPSQMPSEDAKQVWHIPSLPFRNPTTDPYVPGADNLQSPLSSIKGCSMKTVQNGGSLKDYDLESKSKNSCRRMFDLQLPADEYIDSEEGEQFEEEKVYEVPLLSSYTLRGNSVVIPESDMKLSLGSGENASRFDSCLRSSNGFADLNEPVHVEEATSLTPVNFPITCQRDIQGQGLCAKPNSDFLGLPRELFQNTQHRRDNGACSGNSCLEDKKEKQGWLFNNLEARQSRTNLNTFPQEQLPTLWEPKQLELKKIHDHPPFHQSDQSKREPWRERRLNGLEISGRNHNLWSDGVNSISPSVSSWRNSSSQSPVAVQVYPHFMNPAASSNSSDLSVKCPEHIGDKWHRNLNSTSHPSFGSDVSYQKFSHVSQSDSKSSLDCFPTNLNVIIPNGFQDGVVPQRDLAMTDGKEKHGDPPGGLPWLKCRPSCENKPGKSSGFTQTGSSLLQALSHQLSNKIETENGPDSSFIQDSIMASGAHEAEPKKSDIADCPHEKKVLGFLIFDKLHFSKNQSSSLSSPSKSQCYLSEDTQKKGKFGGFDTDLSHDPALPPYSGNQLRAENIVEEKGVDDNLTGSKYHIDLNTRSNEEEGLSIPISLEATVRITVGIDLEAQVLAKTEKGILPQGESSENQPETTIRLSENKDGDPLAKNAQTAAEAIVAISSSSVRNLSEDTTCHSSEASLNHSLHWFAEIVSSTMNGPKSEVSSSDIDYFESMTLKLKETQIEEYWYKLPGQENFEEETGITSSPSRPQKGRARRGKRRKDFQRDILPGLISLSRKDMIEDLQAFGELMRASGCPWQTGLTRRNAARNGCARGKRRLAGHVTITTTATVSSQTKPKLNKNELGFEEITLTGWGKTTRRPRRQRFPAGNPSLQALTQV